MSPSWWPFRRGRDDDQRWVVLDVETTGLDAASDHLLAISAIALHRDGARLLLRPADSFDAVLRHEAATPDRRNILVHGIGMGRQREGDQPAQVLQAFDDWTGGAPLIGFHVGFDRQVIERAGVAHLGRRPRALWIDLAPLAQLAAPGVAARALDEWLEHYGIPCAQRHEAAADTLATAELLLRLWPALRAQGSRNAADLARLARGARWAGAS